MEPEIIQDQEITGTPSAVQCAHQRLVAQVLNPSGAKTGKVRCLECESILDDPHRRELK